MWHGTPGQSAPFPGHATFELLRQGSAWLVGSLSFVHTLWVIRVRALGLVTVARRQGWRDKGRCRASSSGALTVLVSVLLGALAGAEPPSRPRIRVTERSGIADGDSWGQAFDGGYCSARALVYADRCTVKIGQELHSGEFVEFNDGFVTFACGEAGTVCGKTFTCTCDQCDPSVNYESRWWNDRSVTLIPDPGHRIDTVRVSFDGGACTASLDTVTECRVRGSEQTTVGGCRKQRVFGDRLNCGAAIDVCGQGVKCRCLDGGGFSLETPDASSSTRTAKATDPFDAGSKRN